MFARSIAMLACVVLAVATPNGEAAKRWAPPPTTTTSTVTVTASPTATAGNCDVGPAQCCQSIATADSAPGIAGLTLLAVLDALVVDVVGDDVLLGFTCSLLSESCSGTAVCCQNNAFGGLVSVGCIVL